ncbi:hypothetical protein, partial [Microbulbifer taiwanensis]|uniref:hypothetical protein n=1 Tax=Microbulbifer taiwanensis TaxID=986746 RepID=UPI003622C596
SQLSLTSPPQTALQTCTDFKRNCSRRSASIQTYRGLWPRSIWQLETKSKSPAQECSEKNPPEKCKS